MSSALKFRPPPQANVCLLPQHGKDQSDVLLVLDPRVYDEDKPKNKSLVYPITKYHYNFLSGFLAQANIPHSRDDITVMSCAMPVGSETWHRDSALNKVVQKDRLRFISAVRKIKPKLIVAMGKSAATQVAGRSVKITKARGQPYFDDQLGCIVLPTLGPAYVARQPEHKETLQADLDTASMIISANFSLQYNTKIEKDYRWCWDLRPYLDEIRQAGRVAVDAEWTSYQQGVNEWYNPNMRILTVQLAWKPGLALVLPIVYRGVRPPHAYARERLQRQLKTLLEDATIKKVGHNFKGDWLGLYSKLGIETQGYDDDTLLMIHAIDENMLNKSLDDAVRRWCPSISGYNDNLNRDPEHHGKERMDLLSPDKMLVYAGGDADAGIRLFTALDTIIKRDQKAYNCYKKVPMAANRAFCWIEQEGFTVCIDDLEDLEKLLEHQLFGDPDNDNDKGEYGNLIEMIPASIRREFADTGVGLKLTRPDLLRAFLFNHKDGLKLKPVVFTKTTANLKDETKKIASTSTKLHLPYFEGKHPFIDQFIDFAKNEHLLTSNVKGFYKYIFGQWTGEDGRRYGKIRPSYLLHGTVTGRSACLRGDTIISTEDGPKQIDQVTIRDKVWSHENRWRRVSGTFIKPDQEMYEVHFSNGEILCCTEDHRLLTQSGKWVSFRHVCIKETYGRQEFPSERLLSLSDILANYDADRRRDGRVGSNSVGDFTTRDTGTRANEPQGTEVFSVEDGRQKPHEGEKAHQHERGLPGWARLLDTGSPWQTIFRASDSGLRNDWSADREISGKLRPSPYRRRSKQQSSRQYCDSDQGGASRDTHALQEKQTGLRITRANPCGSYPVHDIEVVEDHSYEAAGCFSHNSKNPNGQNFVKRAAGARAKIVKAYRAIFKAPAGHVLLDCDFSQIELRVVAIAANCKAMLKVYRDGGDIHCLTAANVMGLTLEAFMRLKETDPNLYAMRRRDAKVINFGFIYGMGWKRFMAYARTEYGLIFTEEESKRTRERFFAGFPELLTWHERVKEFAKLHGYVRAYDGRMRHLQNVRSDDEGIVSSAERQGVNAPIQAFANDLGLMAIARINQQVSKDLLRLSGFVHDAIIAVAPVERAMEAARTIKRYMETNPLQEWFGFKSPIPITADISMSGTNLAEAEELGDMIDDTNLVSWADVKACIDAKAAAKKISITKFKAPPRKQTFATAPPAMIGEGDIFRTQSGRYTAPAPRIDGTSDRRTTNSIQRMNEWLLSEAKYEAEATDNEFVLTLLRGVNTRHMSQADQDTINMVLWGDIQARENHRVVPAVAFRLPPHQTKRAA